MRHIKIKLMDKVIDSKEWANYNHSIELGNYPVFYKINDNSGVIFIASNVKYWVANDATNMLLATILENEPKPPEPAPNAQFSESFILKLVAISKDSSLAKELTK